MRSKISVIGTGEQLLEALAAADHSDVVAVTPGGWPSLAGSDVVVLVSGDPEAVGREVALRASHAVIVCASGEAESCVEAVLRSSLLPRGHVLGVDAAAAQHAVEAILFDRGARATAAVHCRGETGVAGRVATVPVTLGRGGVRSIG